MTFKKIAFVFCVLCLLLCSCNIENYNLVYIFNNRSSYTVKITLSEPYKTNTEENKKTSPFIVESMGVVKVIIQNNGIVNFRWTTSSAEDNSKIYCVTEGQKATFKDR